METQYAAAPPSTSTSETTSLASTAPHLSAPGKITSPQALSPKSGFSKPIAFTPATQLTGAAAMAARAQQQQQQQQQQQKPASPNQQEEPKDTGVSTNPAAVLSTFPMSRPTDAPNRQNSPAHKNLSGLPSIATAASAMDTSGDTPSTASTSASLSATASASSPATTANHPNSTTDPALLNQPAPTTPAYPALTSLPPNLPPTLRTGNLEPHFPAGTPTTPSFTPTTPFSPATPGGSRAKHTCPHCNQTFTRHHNLKSHLLTHSQEKPFICNTCQARFRRLHDLKRHSKLHTGERPHECHKCGRKFARGDALARHARAEGGCAGRRASMAGFGEDGMQLVGEGDGMEGLEGLITGQDGDGDIDMDADPSTPNASGNKSGKPQNSRRQSLPSIKTNFAQPGGLQHANTAPHQHQQQSMGAPTPISAFSQQQTPATSSTPGAGYTPLTGRTASASATSQNNNLFAQPTQQAQKSPSPATAATPTANRNDNAATPRPQPQMQHHQHSQQFMSGVTQQQPPLPQPQQGAPTANMGSGIPQHQQHQQGQAGTMLPHGLDVWTYVRTLEDRVKSLEGQVRELTERGPAAATPTTGTVGATTVSAGTGQTQQQQGQQGQQGQGQPQQQQQQQK